MLPASLHFSISHYMQDLYGCGAESESLVRLAYHSLVERLVNYSRLSRLSCRRSTEALARALDAYVLTFVDIDWHLDDMQFVRTLPLADYLVHTLAHTYPLTRYVDPAGLTGSQVLDSIFSMPKEEFTAETLATPKPVSKPKPPIMTTTKVKWNNYSALDSSILTCSIEKTAKEHL